MAGMTILRSWPGPLAVFVVTAALAVAPSGSANASTIASPERGGVQLYVAPWGSDHNAGSRDHPFATIGRAQQAVRARIPDINSDIVVNLRGGTYTLARPLGLGNTDSGHNGHRVSWQAYGYGTSHRERVTISGGRTVAGWHPDKGVWRADVGALETRQLYVADRRAARATLGKGLPGKVTMTATGYVTTSPVPRSWHAPRDLELMYRPTGYLEGRCGVAAIRASGKQTKITMRQPCWSLAQALYGTAGLQTPVSVDNSSSFLSRPGTWYLDRTKPGHHELLYRPRPGENPGRTTVIAPVLGTLVNGTVAHDLTVRGFTFAYASWLGPNDPAGFAGAWSMYLRPAPGGETSLLTVPGAVTFQSAQRVDIEGNRFIHLGGQGLELDRSSSHNVVRGNLVTDISDGGIQLGVVPPETTGTNRGNRIVGNSINRVGQDNHAASGIWDAGSQDITIEHNQINDVPYSGITSGPADDVHGLMHGNRIIGNRITRTNLVLDDGGGIYLRGEQGSSYADGGIVRDNAVSDSRNGFWRVGIYTDDSTNRLTVVHNAVYNYVASIGGCSEEWGNRPVQNIRYVGNYWDDAVPDWVPRRSYPGAWVPADTQHPEDGCGNPHDLHFAGNSLLEPASPAQACASNPGCALILRFAGPGPAEQRLLAF
jgi:hypothetical protein